MGAFNMICVLVCLLLVFPIVSFAAPAVTGSITHYPVEVESCNRRVVFDAAPRRAVSNDVNLTEMMIALGLKNRLVGYTGISGWKTGNPELMRKLTGVPELAKQYPSAETLIGVGADFYFAGWNYGMHPGGAVTPATLAPLGVKVYELAESCAHVMKMPAATVQGVYDDLQHLGQIFDVADRAQALTHQMQSRIATVQGRLSSHYSATRKAREMHVTRVFVYDSGADKPFSTGALAMPSALISAAGGRNIMDDVMQSWTAVNWESVVARNPEVIVIVDYGAVTAAQKMQFLLQLPAIAKLDAIVHQRFVVLSYEEATPGIHNAQAIEKLAHALHPDAFEL